MNQDSLTIYAPATPVAKSGIAVIRVSGQQAAHVIDHFHCRTPKPRVAVYTPIRFPDHSPQAGKVIDYGLVLWFPAPHSFTGEDTVEFHVHGSKAVLRTLLQFLGEIPEFRLAEPGEFSRRAFHNGKMDLVQAEGLADLIEAETAMQLRQALRQMAGELSSLYESWREQLIGVQAFIEAYIDFADEDIPEDVVEQARSHVLLLIEVIQHHLQDAGRGEKIREGIEVVIIGAPNTGKSTLLNALAQKDIAIVSAIAGTTRDALEVYIDIDGIPFTLVDTAGIRETEDIIEQEGVRRAKQKAKHADWKIILLDADTLPSLPEETLALMDEHSTLFINKADKTGKTGSIHIRDKAAYFISATQPETLAPLFDTLHQIAETYSSALTSPLITRTRYREALLDCLTHLERFQSLKEHTLELAAEDLRMAARALGRITGRIGVEDILDKLFSAFCIGK